MTSAITALARAPRAMRIPISRTRLVVAYQTTPKIPTLASTRATTAAMVKSTSRKRSLPTEAASSASSVVTSKSGSVGSIAFTLSWALARREVRSRSVYSGSQYIDCQDIDCHAALSSLNTHLLLPRQGLERRPTVELVQPYRRRDHRCLLVYRPRPHPDFAAAVVIPSF